MRLLDEVLKSAFVLAGIYILIAGFGLFGEITQKMFYQILVAAAGIIIILLDSINDELQKSEEE